MTELKDYTTIIKTREKTIQLSFWDIGNDLLRIKNNKLYIDKYSNMEAYVSENFTFSPRHAWRMMAVADRYDKTAVTSVGLEKMYLLLQVPDQHRDEIIEMVEEEKLDLEGLKKTVKRFKTQAGSVPHYSDKPEEHKSRLTRQFNEIRTHFEGYKEFKEDIIEEIHNWLKSAKKTDLKEIKEAEQMLKEIG